MQKCNTFFLYQSYIVFPLKSGWLWKQSVLMLYRNLNFGQAVSLKLIKITIVSVYTPSQVFFDIDLPQAVLAFSRCLKKSLMQLAQMCCLVVTGMYTRPLSFYESHSKQFFISERINSILCFADLSILQLRMVNTNFWNFQGTLATFNRCGGQKLNTSNF